MSFRAESDVISSGVESHFERSRESFRAESDVISSGVEKDKTQIKAELVKLCDEQN